MLRSISTAFVLTFMILFIGLSANVQAKDLFEKARGSILYIYFDVTDSKTGEKKGEQGTGIVISENGFVLTASHLFRGWLKQERIYKGSNVIYASLKDKIGFALDPPLVLNVVDIGDPDGPDIALLKLSDPTRGNYEAVEVCFSKAASVQGGSEIFAFGFPANQSFQQVRGTLGTQNAPGGRWAAESNFSEGMSGGPVYDARGILIGLVKGGFSGSPSVRWITPISFAAPHLQVANVEQQCPRETTEPRTWAIPQSVLEKATISEYDFAVAPDQISKISPDGRFAVGGKQESSAGDFLVDVYDVEHAKKFWSGKLSFTHRSFGFSDDSKKLLMGTCAYRPYLRCDDGLIYVLDLQTGGLTEIKGIPGTVSHLTFTPDGNALYTSLYKAYVVNIASGKIIRELPVSSESWVPILSTRVTGIAYIKADLNTVAVGLSNGDLEVWDLKRSVRLWRQTAHDDSNLGVTDLFVLSKSASIVTRGIDQNIKIWNAENGQLLKVLRGYMGAVVSETGSRFIWIGGRLLNVSTGNTVTGQFGSLMNITESAGKITAVSQFPGKIVTMDFGIIASYLDSLDW